MFTHGDLTYEYDINNKLFVYGISNWTTENIVIPDEVNGEKVYGIVDSAFDVNQIIKTVSLPPTLEVIGPRAFAGRRNLKQIIIRDDGKTHFLKIEQQAFCGCVELEKFQTGSIEVEIEKEAFMNCNVLSQFDPRIQKLHHHAFVNCYKLAEISFADEAEIGYSAFAHSSIRVLNIPANATFEGNTHKYMLQNKIRIRCPETALVVNFAFDGFRIEIVEA
jgi:hypothetical protein